MEKDTDGKVDFEVEVDKKEGESETKVNGGGQIQVEERVIGSVKGSG